jgi:hypothetical protein
MLEPSRQNITARLRATIEEELGALRRFADVPSAELEAMADRIARAVQPFLDETGGSPRETRAA